MRTGDLDARGRARAGRDAADGDTFRGDGSGPGATTHAAVASHPSQRLRRAGGLVHAVCRSRLGAGRRPGGWILNHQLVIGGGGFGLATPARPRAVDQADYQHTFGYGGLWLEYLIAPMNVVHGSVGTLVGAGGITYQRFRPASLAKDQKCSSVFVLDPVVAVEVNVTTFLRVALQGGSGLSVASIWRRWATPARAGSPWVAP